MEKEKEKFIERYNDVKENVVKAIDKALERAIGNRVVNFGKCKDNYTDVYPLIAASLKRGLDEILGKSVSDEVFRFTKKGMNKYLNDYRVWHDYAGDYRNKNKE